MNHGIRSLFLVLMVAVVVTLPVCADQNAPSPAQLVLPCTIQDVWAGLEGGYHFILKDSVGHALTISHRDIWHSSESEFTVNKMHLTAGSEEEALLLKALESAFPSYYDTTLDQKLADHRGLTQDETSRSFKQAAVRHCLGHLRQRQAGQPK